MTKQLFRGPSLQTATPILLLLSLGMATVHAQQPAPTGGNSDGERTAGQEFASRGQREAREIKYSDWRKTCFKTPGTDLVCRTSITGTFETGQSAVRIDLTEREGDKAARLQLFVPVGLYLQAGVRLTIDQGNSHRLPYTWCLTNTCIAADLADPQLIKEMEAGQKLLLEVVDYNVATVSTSLPLNHFATVRHATPAQMFEQTIDE
jgi:invasion protein IalB